VCVATDVAARGIDLPNLNLVIHADLPNDAETLQHRSGRTGRAGRKGVSVLLVPLSRRRKAEQMLATAKVSPVWSGPPQAEDIRRLDQQRMLQDPILTAVNSEEDLEMARSVLANRTPEEIAAALVRIYRSKLPAAEDVFDPGPGENRGQSTGFREAKPLRRKDAPDSGPRDFTWFRLDIGRKNNADPKWLLPMICRRGHVTKPDIGAIRINENETRFEIANHMAEKFAAAMVIADKDDVTISRLDGAMPAPAPKSERKRSFERGDGFKPKPRAEKTAYEERKPHNADEKPRYDAKKSFSDKPKFKDKAKFKPKFEGEKPKFFGGKPKPEGAGFKIKKAPWKKEK
jgi:ATP-dependent RNA helicase DeaD